MYSRCSGVGSGCLAAASPSQVSATVELVAAQQEAPVALGGIPFESLDEQSGVPPKPLEIGFQRLDEESHAGLERIVVREWDPVALANALRDPLIGNGTQDDRNHTLVEADRVLDLLSAKGRGNGVWADDEDECVAAFDRRAQHGGKHLAGADPVYVDPGVLTVVLQPLRQGARRTPSHDANTR